MKRLMMLAGALVAGLSVAPTGAIADYPDRPVRIQLGFAAGGGADILARWYAEQLSKLSGGTFIVENKVGASGNLALDAAAKAKPDGSTLLLASTVTTAGNVAIFKSLPFDVAKDLVPIVGFAETPFVLAVAGDSPPKTVDDLTAFIKSKNGKTTYGSATTSALASSALYLNAVGAEATYVGYKATANAIQDVTSKQIDFAFADVVYAVGQAKQGRIKLLAIASDERTPSLSDLPTLKETTGARTGDIVAHWGIWAPAGVSKDITDKLEKWGTQITQTPETQKFLAEQGATARIAGGAEYKQRLQVGLKAWADAVRIGKIELQ